jgi:hypothetical protein
MRWCELNRIDYLFGLARNERLTAAIAAELQETQPITGTDWHAWWRPRCGRRTGRAGKIAMASACPYQNEFALAHLRLAAAAR